jgi:hypothetical protein
MSNEHGKDSFDEKKSASQDKFLEDITEALVKAFFIVVVIKIFFYVHKSYHGDEL